MRLSGEYEIDMARLRQQDKDRMDAAYRSTLLRREAAQKRKLPASMSLPSLGGPSSPEPGPPLRPSASSAAINKSPVSYPGEEFQPEADIGAQPSTAPPRNDSNSNASAAVAASAEPDSWEAVRIRAAGELMEAVANGSLVNALQKQLAESAPAGAANTREIVEQAAPSAAEASTTEPASNEDQKQDAPQQINLVVNYDSLLESDAITADKMVERSKDPDQS